MIVMGVFGDMGNFLARLFHLHTESHVQSGERRVDWEKRQAYDEKLELEAAVERLRRGRRIRQGYQGYPHDHDVTE